MDDVRTGKQLLKEYEKFISETAIPLSKEINFDKQSKLDFVKVAIYCSLIEQSCAIITLVKNGLGYHAYPLMRAQLEGFADLTNIINKPGYIHNLELHYEDSMKKLRVNAKSGNPYLRLIAEHFNLEKDLSRSGKKLKELVKKGAKILEPKTKFIMAGLRTEYDALYAMLCDHSHGGLRALVWRHVEENNGEFEIVGLGKDDVNQFAALLQTSFDSLIRASVALHSCFNTPHVSLFEEILNKHHNA